MNIIKRSQAAKRVGVSPRYLDRLIENDGFPLPVKVANSDGWIDNEIDAWIEKKMADRDSQGALA